MKTIKSWEELKKGAKFKVIACSNNHNYPLNKILRLNRDGLKSTAMSNCAEGLSGNELKCSDILIVITESLNELQIELDKIEREFQKERNEIKQKINFCLQNGTDTYDEDEAKVYNILSTIDDSSTSKIEKAKLIAKLLK